MPSMEHLSMTRTLLLLNTTHQKLSYEDHLFDTSSPLKALQLRSVAQRLNTHLKSEQIEHTQPRASYREVDYRMMAAGLDEDDYEDDFDEEVVADVEDFAIDSDESDIISTPSETFLHPASIRYAEYEVTDELDDLQFDDMPGLSRQPSRETESEADTEDDLEEATIAVHKFLNSHHSSIKPIIDYSSIYSSADSFHSKQLAVAA